MSRIKGVLSILEKQGKKALIPYITAGDPKPELTVGLMHTLVEAGADIIELGVPFSDPMADGPVIQLACERALTNNVGLGDVLKMVAEFRSSNQSTPVVLMGYLNPIEYMGYELFVNEAAAAGVDGLLAVDMPTEEADGLVSLLRQNAMDAVFLVAPTTTDDRIRQICEHSSGYVYYVSLRGVTGSAALNTEEVAAKVGHIKQLSSIPVGVGFGISNAKTAAEVAGISDGVIVGSVIVNIIAENQHQPDVMKQKVKQLLASMREAMDAR
jgi:tryptophan synthase alpha chain